VKHPDWAADKARYRAGRRPGREHRVRPAAIPGLAEWITKYVAFPNLMVDRITPATSDADRAHVRDELHVDGGWPVVAEPLFCSWKQRTFRVDRTGADLASQAIATL